MNNRVFNALRKIAADQDERNEIREGFPYMGYPVPTKEHRDNLVSHVQSYDPSELHEEAGRRFLNDFRRNLGLPSFETLAHAGYAYHRDFAEDAAAAAADAELNGQNWVPAYLTSWKKNAQELRSDISRGVAENRPKIDATARKVKQTIPRVVEKGKATYERGKKGVQRLKNWWDNL